MQCCFAYGLIKPVLLESGKAACVWRCMSSQLYFIDFCKLAHVHALILSKHFRSGVAALHGALAFAHETEFYFGSALENFCF